MYMLNLNESGVNVIYEERRCDEQMDLMMTPRHDLKILLRASLTHSTMRGLSGQQKQFTIRFSPTSLPRRAPHTSSMFICYQSIHQTN